MHMKDVCLILKMTIRGHMYIRALKKGPVDLFLSDILIFMILQFNVF